MLLVRALRANYCCCCLLGNHSVLQGAGVMPLAGVKDGCLLLRSVLVANACLDTLKSSRAVEMSLERREYSDIDEQHTSTVCSTVVTEAVCVLLSTQPHLMPPQDDPTPTIDQRLPLRRTELK
ncbi:hypothetical protein BHE90_016689 [Fusarium euwallaceae]|uniref:Uncharacterized protein n=2 Tax=Fusarium solani species complex TaxID=232080 RepID=A0A3M2R8M3_9HYPO|nr:hypothetical protein CDV36_015671 [Fusarium kuroshium]RTE68932.1 hypothetical protein BHE90_016689 [Fusarium euwallaceae]